MKTLCNQPMSVRNYTGRPVTIKSYGQNGGDAEHTLSVDGHAMLAFRMRSSSTVWIEGLGSTPVYVEDDRRVIDLPDQDDYTFLIVDREIAEFLPNRTDLLFVDTYGLLNVPMLCRTTGKE
jgi:hypothetical protein